MKRPVAKAWNGGSREFARIDAKRRQNMVLDQMRKLHDAYTSACEPWAVDIPFKARSVPGWVYLPVDDVVITLETYERIRRQP